MDRLEYLKKFGEPGTECYQRICAALERAHDIRKFEIDLYWRRSAYFWVFIAAIFVAYFSVYTSDTYINSAKENQSYSLLYVLGLLGYFTSFCWYLVNRGSKYWQTNWETHIDMLEDKVTGPLYKLVLKSEIRWCRPLGWRPLGPYPFSVSNLNMIVSILFCVAWLAIVFLIPFDRGPIAHGLDQACTLPIIGILIIIGTILILIFVDSNHTSSKSKKDRDFLIRPFPLRDKINEL